jgi:hypothetical protein
MGRRDDRPVADDIEAYPNGLLHANLHSSLGRFAPLEPEPITNVLDDRKVTLYGALKMEMEMGMGMDRDLYVLAYENHKDLTSAIRSSFATFDSLLAERTGAAARSDVWVTQHNRTEDEIVGLLSEADDADPNPAAATRIAAPRPGMKKLLGSRRYRAAIASEVCRLMAHTGQSFSQVVGKVSQIGQRDDELLESLEQWRAEVAPPNDPAVVDLDLGALFAEAAGEWFRTSNDLSSSASAPICQTTGSLRTTANCEQSSTRSSNRREPSWQRGRHVRSRHD